MILVDTSIWTDRLRGNDASLAGSLNSGLVLAHPFVIGELALRSLRQRDRVLAALRDLAQAVAGTGEEVPHFIHRNEPGGLDVQLLASTRLTAWA